MSAPTEETGGEDRELLRRAADALWNCAKAALTVKPALDTPYRDAPQWTPYTRWVERPAEEAHDLAMQIREHLAAKEVDQRLPVSSSRPGGDTRGGDGLVR